MHDMKEMEEMKGMKEMKELKEMKEIKEMKKWMKWIKWMKRMKRMVWMWLDVNGMGIKWGLAHISEVERERGYRSLRTRRSFLVRFDCDLRREYDNPYYKNNWDQVGKYSEETFFHTRTIMDEKEKQKALQETQQGTY